MRKVKEEIPGIILENCASGGHKLEPLMMSECSMASFSDAHECEEIPVIAASFTEVFCRDRARFGPLSERLIL